MWAPKSYKELKAAPTDVIVVHTKGVFLPAPYIHHESKGCMRSDAARKPPLPPPNRKFPVYFPSPEISMQLSGIIALSFFLTLTNKTCS
jgi:hypothetical protein